MSDNLRFLIEYFSVPRYCLEESGEYLSSEDEIFRRYSALSVDEKEYLSKVAVR